MANQFTDRCGYSHAAHTVIRENAIIHTVWTRGPDDTYLGSRSLTVFPVGHEWVPAGVWVYVSDFAPERMRGLTEAQARRLLAGWRAAGAGLPWQEPTITTAPESASFRA